VFVRFIDVPHGAICDNATDSLERRSERKNAAPATRINTGALFDDDDVSRTGEFDGCRAKVANRPVAAHRCTRGHEPERHDRARDLLVRCPSWQICRDLSCNSEAIQRVGDRACIKPFQALNEIVVHK
jgi:hypothetical protein